VYVVFLDRKANGEEQPLTTVAQTGGTIAGQHRKVPCLWARVFSGSGAPGAQACVRRVPRCAGSGCRRGPSTRHSLACTNPGMPNYRCWGPSRTVRLKRCVAGVSVGTLNMSWSACLLWLTLFIVSSLCCEQMKSSDIDQELFTESYCKVCSAQLISESQRVAHYEVGCSS